jgi:hypothetical protein
MTVVARTGALLAALAVAGALVGLAGLVRNDSPSPAAARTSVVRYERAVARPARDGGFVIQEGLKPALPRLAADQPGNTMFQAVSWVNQLEQVRVRFASAAEGLKDRQLLAAARAFDESLLLYKRTAETIGAAAIASGEPRVRLLETAAASGKKADARYDQALALVQAARRSAGLTAAGANG